MNDENDKGNGAEDTATPSAGANEQSDSRAVGNEREGCLLLDKSAEEVGTHDSKVKTGGANADKPSTEWGIASAWTASFDDAEPRVLEKRDYLWASELYSAPIDVWLKMRAEPYTNPPNTRSLMKFESAHLVEWVIGLILRRAGILKGEEVRCEYQYPDLLKVTGRMDKLAGGTPNYEYAKSELLALNLPEGFMRGMEKIITTLQAKYPNGLAEKPIEIKSVSSFAMDSMENKKVSIKRHRVQLYHYLISGGYKNGMLVYYCRDDSRMMEFNVALDSPVEKEYRERIELLTRFHGETEAPPKEKMIVWDEDSGKMSKNFNIEYSNYLTKLYGFEKPRDYSEIWGKKATSWNRVLGRVKSASKMTPLNLAVLEEIKDAGYNPNELISQMPDKPVEEEAE